MQSMYKSRQAARSCVDYMIGAKSCYYNLSNKVKEDDTNVNKIICTIIYVAYLIQVHKTSGPFLSQLVIMFANTGIDHIVILGKLIALIEEEKKNYVCG